MAKRRRRRRIVTRATLLRDCRKQIRECEQALRDIAWWNKHRAPEFPDDAPLDPEPWTVMLHYFRLIEGAYAAGRDADQSWFEGIYRANADLHHPDGTLKTDLELAAEIENQPTPREDDLT